MAEGYTGRGMKTWCGYGRSWGKLGHKCHLALSENRLPQTSTEQSSVSIRIRFWGKATSATFCGKIEAASNWSNAANVLISLAAAKSLARTRDDKQQTMSQGKEHWHFPCNWYFRGMVHSNSTHFNRYQKLGSCLKSWKIMEDPSFHAFTVFHSTSNSTLQHFGEAKIILASFMALANNHQSWGCLEARDRAW